MCASAIFFLSSLEFSKHIVIFYLDDLYLLFVRKSSLLSKEIPDPD